MCTVEAATVNVMFRHSFTLLGVIGTLIGVLYVNCLYFNNLCVLFLQILMYYNIPPICELTRSGNSRTENR